jgi:HSP20 family molecular chaperone IbpA
VSQFCSFQATTNKIKNMSLTPFQSRSLLNPSMDPFWNTEMPGVGTDIMGFPSQVGSRLGFPRSFSDQLGFPDVPTPQIGIDLTEESDKWVVHADMPGFKDEDVELSVENGMLGVKGTRDKIVESDTGISHRVEVCMFCTQ